MRKENNSCPHWKDQSVLLQWQACTVQARAICSIECSLIGLMDLVLDLPSTHVPKVSGCGPSRWRDKLQTVSPSKWSSWTPKDSAPWTRIQTMMWEFSLWQFCYHRISFIIRLDRLTKMRCRIWIWWWIWQNTYRLRVLVSTTKTSIRKILQNISHHLCGSSEISLCSWLIRRVTQ